MFYSTYPTATYILRGFKLLILAFLSLATCGESSAFDAPDYHKIIRHLEEAGNTITIYGSRPAVKPWESALDNTVYTAGSSQQPYFYAQNPEDDSFILCAESRYYDLEHSAQIRIKIAGLEPDTTYFYKVNDSEEIIRVRTKPLPGVFEPFQFTVVGDSQGPYDALGDEQLSKDRHKLGPWPGLNRARGYPFNLTTVAMRSRFAPDFSVHLGDIVEDGRYAIQWEKELFGQLKYYLLHAPVYVTMGNHEQHDSRFWKYFDLSLPENAPQTKRAYYAFNWGEARFIVLDTSGQWYELRDIDSVSGDTSYMFTQEASACLSTLSSKKERNPFKRLINKFILWKARKYLVRYSDRQVSRRDFEATLGACGINGRLRRAVLTATLQEPVESGQYSISVRSPFYGRIAVMVPAGEKRWDAQMLWLEGELRKNQDKRYIFVFCHHPLRYGVVNEQICALLEKYRVTAAFSGHRHHYALQRANGVSYFLAGGHSDTVFTPIIRGEEEKETFIEHREGPHYILVKVGVNYATIQCVTRENILFTEHRLPPRRMEENHIPH